MLNETLRDIILEHIIVIEKNKIDRSRDHKDYFRCSGFITFKADGCYSNKELNPSEIKRELSNIILNRLFDYKYFNDASHILSLLKYEIESGDISLALKRVDEIAMKFMQMKPWRITADMTGFEVKGLLDDGNRRN